MLRCGSIENRGTQPVTIGMAELERGEVLGVRVEQPWMVDQREQDQRLAWWKCAPHATDQRTRREPWTRHRRYVARKRRTAAALPTLLSARAPFPTAPIFIGRLRGRKQRAHPF